MSDSERDAVVCKECGEYVVPEVIGHAIRCPACSFLLYDPNSGGNARNSDTDTDRDYPQDGGNHE